MKPLTIAEALALPSQYEMPADIAEYADYYGASMSQGYLQSYVVFNYNSAYVPNVAILCHYGALGLVILLAIFPRFIFPLCPTTNAFRGIRTAVSKHILLSSTVGTKSMEPAKMFGTRWLSFQVPSRLHGILVFVLVAFNFIVLFTPYYILVPNLLYVRPADRFALGDGTNLQPNLSYQDIGYPWDQYLRGFSDRTGVISFGLTPLVILLAGRNNVISFLTGASYPTLQLYHRWIARVTATHALLHGLGYTILEVGYGAQYYKEAFSEPYWNWGCAALGGGAILLIFSMRRMRELFYEAFLIGHILGAILWIVGCYYHVWYLDPDYSYLKYMYASIGIWSGDRVLRLLRLLYLNLRVFARPKAVTKKQLFSAEGLLHEDGSFIRLKVVPATPWPSNFGGPGTYVFISSPSHNVWESHPFTITWPLNMPTATGSSSSSTTGTSTPISNKEEFISTSTDLFSDVDPASFELVLKTYSGYTRRLAKSLASPADTESGKSVNGARKIKILVEGPYGEATALEGFGAVILVAGGSGISATVAHLADLAKHAAKSKLLVKRVCVVWAIREVDTAKVLLPYLQRLQSLLPTTDLQLALNIYYTGTATYASSEIESIFKSVASFVSLQVHTGRPIIADHIAQWRDFADAKIALSVCGPASLCDGAREAVKCNLGGKHGFSADQLVFEEEAFTW